MNDRSAGNETSVWTGHPSQWTNFGVYALCLLASLTLVLAIVAIPWAIWRWLVTRNQTYELTTERLRMRSGVFNKKLDELELYRVRDSKVEQPFWQRLFGLGTITIVSGDATTPTLVIPAIKDAEQVREHLRNSVEAQRGRHHVRLNEFEGGGMPN